MGEEAGEEMYRDSKLIFELCAVRTVAGQPYTVQTLYYHLVSHGRPVPNCSMRLTGRPGPVYSVEFFEQFAANI